MNEYIKNKLGESLESTRIGAIEPDYSEVEKIFTLKGRELADIEDKNLTSSIYSLSQYLIFLQVQTNIRNIKYLDAKRTYELELSRQISKVDAKTIKEKINLAVLGNEELQKLEKDMRTKEADHILFDKIPDHVLELINAFKKELGRRYPNRFHGKPQENY